MREIKFRGKREDTGEWVYGSLLFVPYTGMTYMFLDAARIVKLSEIIPVDPKTVGQYTGLKDRNGKEIYEGDVLINPKGIRGEIKYVPEYAAFLAYWKHDGECGYDYLDKEILMKCEVIGNIYENPYLLEKEE